MCALLALAALALFGLMEAGGWELHQVRLKSRVQRAIPKVREETSRELRVLTQAIEDYKARFGCYPPDHLLSQNPPVVDSITNQLLYELFGTVHNTRNDTFMPTIRFPGISAKLVKEFFNVSAFKNTAEQPEMVRQFIKSGEISSTLGVSEKPDVGVLAFFPNWEGMDSDLLQ